MRTLIGLMCVLALAAMGCSETPLGPIGGSGGAAGSGGAGGIAGAGGMAGAGGGDGNGALCQDRLCKCTEEGIRAAITEGGGPFTFDCDGPTTVVTEAPIVIDNDAILDGESNLTVDGNGSHVVFTVAGEVTADLRGFAVTRGGDYFVGGLGAPGYAHGCIENRGTLTLTDTSVSDNEVGIENEGALTLTNSTVSENGICGIWSNGTLTLTNSTVSGNGGECGGAVTIFGGTMTLLHATISNSVYVQTPPPGTTPTIVSTATLIDGACGTDEGIPVNWTSNGYNVESPGDTCGFDQPTDLFNVSAMELNLGELANGGPTMTHPLLTEPTVSTAIDRVPADDCEVETDQRGLPRPGGTNCDAGAFEVQGFPVTDCTGVHDGRICTVDDSPGHCFEDVCRLSDCSDLADGTRCARVGCAPAPVPFPGYCFRIYGWCWDRSCSTGVGDCTGFEDLTTCNVTPVAQGLCIDDSCEPTVSDCVGEQDGTLCRFPREVGGVTPTPGGFCVDGQCEEPQ